MTFTVTKKSYRFDMTVEDFLPIIEVETISNSRKIDEHPEIESSDQSLVEILEEKTLAVNIEYDGHFGSSVFFDLDIDDDTPDNLIQIKHVIEDYATWAKDAMEKIKD